MHEEKYTLTWHTYSDQLRDILKELSSDDSFTDVTLVTDDKKQIKAHRNILSAWSTVFKEILHINTNNNHPVIYLRGIQHSEMESILQFIYLGQAKFYEERMNEFLTVAKNLDIRELATGIEDGDFADVHEEDTNTETEQSPIEAYDVGKPSNIDIDEADHGQHEHKTYSKAMTEGNLTRHIQSAHVGVKYACNQCNKQFTEQSSLTRHIQSAHEGVKYACNQCDKQYQTQESLTRHFQSVHERVKYACNQCNYQATQQSNLTRHIISQHKSVK